MPRRKGSGSCGELLACHSVVGGQIGLSRVEEVAPSAGSCGSTYGGRCPGFSSFPPGFLRSPPEPESRARARPLRAREGAVIPPGRVTPPRKDEPWWRDAPDR